MPKEKGLFNPAFKDLRLKLKRAEKASKESESKDAKKAETERTDKQFFLEAMGDVAPLPGKKRKVARSPGGHMRPAHPAPDDEQEAMNHLHDLIKGSIELDITFSDEYMEGSVKGFSGKLMKKLKRGKFPVQDYIDLHGLTKKDAETMVRDFLLQSHKLGLRCVLIVHGRGLNSPDSFPVLKERLPVWLGRGPIKKIVLAFATARTYDGGPGAIYVLLRRR
jgi:DNA-nicking Smr family endonuclease